MAGNLHDQLWAGIWSLSGGAVSALAAVWMNVRKARHAKARAAVKAGVDIQEAINDGFKILTDRYEGRDDLMSKRLTAMEDEIHDLKAHIDTLTNALRQNGVPVPEFVPRKSLKVIAGGKP